MATAVILALGGAAFESEVVLSLQRDRRDVTIVRRCVDVPDLLAAAATGQARAVLVSVATPQLDADLVTALRARRVEPIGVVAADGAAGADEHRLHQIGVRTVLTAEADGFGGLVGAALERASAVEEVATAPIERSTSSGPDPEPGSVIAVWGPTGAPGRSTVAMGVSAELASNGEATLLIDADVYGGAIGQLLAMMDESSGVLAAARSAKHGTLGPAELARHARVVADNLRVLTGLPRADRWPELSEATVDGLLVAARALASYVVVDCGFSLEADEELSFDTAAPRRNGATLRIIEEADLVFAVGAADPVGLARLARGVVDLRTVAPTGAVQIVVNRWRSGLGWTREEVVCTVERLTGSSGVVVLPEDRASCDSCVLHGRTLTEAVPRSRLRLAMRELAAVAKPVG